METTGYKEALLSFNTKSSEIQSLTKVTTNGEICFDADEKEFVVFDETYAYEVGRTTYPMCALALLESYSAYYLNQYKEE